MRTSQSRSWSVSFRRGSFLRRGIGQPPGEEVEQLAAYPSFAEITTSMTSDSLGRRVPRPDDSNNPPTFGIISPLGGLPCAGEFSGSPSVASRNDLLPIPRLGRREHVRDRAQKHVEQRSESLSPYRTD